MKFTFIGTGTAAPSANLHPSCIFFELDGREGLLDLGAGAVHRLAGAGIDPMDVEKVFFSHYHSDHVSDLIMLLHSNNATPGKIRTKALELYGPVGLDHLARTLMELFPETVPENYKVLVREVKETGFAEIAPNVKIKCCRTGHTDYSLAYRFESPDGNFVYTGDCAFSEELVDFCKGTDVLITECSYTDENRTEDHLCTAETAALAANSNVGTLVIVHRYPDTAAADIMHEINLTYQGPCMIPSEGETLIF